jgi:hypothetical protein
MGSWVTLHLFDEGKFMNDVIPSLKLDTDEFRENVAEYLSYFNIGGTDRLNEHQLLKLISKTSTNILETASKFDLLLKNFKENEQTNVVERGISEIANNDGYYDFAKFFEYSIFNICADFFPYIPLGKAGLFNANKPENNSLFDSIVYTHMNRSYMYSCDGAGIECWIPAEDTMLLYYCMEEMNIENNEFLKIIKGFLEVAIKNNLGIIVGRDLRGEGLERLPRNKILSELEWDKINIKDKLLFKR